MQGGLLIRADASPQIGVGHVMRCLALAQAWQDAGGAATFAMVMDAPALVTHLESEGIRVVPLAVEAGSLNDAICTIKLAHQVGAQWVVVDGYHFDADYQRAIKDAGLKLLCIDDIGHARHYYADIVLNQNLHADERLYSKREPYTQLLLGTRYVLLRREFLKWQNWRREIPEVARRVLVTMGGSDPENVTLKVVQALQQVNIDGLEVVVVVGPSNPHYYELEAMARAFCFPLRLKRNVVNMPELMAWADVAVIAAGNTLWELLFMQTAVLSYVRNHVQDLVISGLEKQGVIKHLGDYRQLNPSVLASCIEEILVSRERRYLACLSGRMIVDGKGSSRVLNILLRKEVE